jgi:hypothetical protein
MQMTPEERLYRDYLDAFNRHDLEGVMEFFDAKPVFVGATGSRSSDLREVRRTIQEVLDDFVEGRVELLGWNYDAGVGVAEWSFSGASRMRGAIKSVGADVVWIQDGRFKELHAYFQPVLLDPEHQPRAANLLRLPPPGSRVYR